MMNRSAIFATIAQALKEQGQQSGCFWVLIVRKQMKVIYG